MLIRFEVENFRSILEPIELSMVAVDSRPSVVPKPHLRVSLLPLAGIFGPNASGKSNLLFALRWLRTAIATSLHQWDEEIPVDPFAFGDAKKKDSSFALELEIDGIRFEYLLDIGRRKVSYEALFHYPEGRRRRIFEREGNDLTLRKGLGELAGTRALLTDRSLALSIMRRFDEPLTSNFAHEVTRIKLLGQSLRGARFPSLFKTRSTLDIFDTEGVRQGFELPVEGDSDSELMERISMRNQALSLLKLADLGVTEVEVKREDEEVGTNFRFPPRRLPQLIHRSQDESVPFEYQNESEGTKTWFTLIGPVLGALNHGGIVLVDELDASLHPTITADLVHLFANRNSNPQGAQLIFTTHDTNLLNQLNRDEAWLTQKLDTGATRFGSLSDFAGERVRHSRNLESGYLSGRFGALPDTARPEVLRDLGLIR